MHTLKAGDQGRDPFNQNFRKFRSKTQFFRFGPTWKVLKNGPLRKQRVMVWDLWQVDFYPFSVFQGLLLLNFRVRSRVFESAVSFTLAQIFLSFLYWNLASLHSQGEIVLKELPNPEETENGRVKTNRYVPANIYFSLVLIYRRGACDVAAGTAWDTSRTNENMRRRQPEPSQSFTACMPANLNSSQLRRYVGGKYWDDQCCRALLFSYWNSILGTTVGHIEGASLAYENQAKQMSRINSLTKDRTCYSTPEEISKVFNEHFITVTISLITPSILNLIWPVWWIS